MVSTPTPAPPPAPFADVAALEARWRHLDDGERQRAERLLADASDLIRQECPRWQRAPDSTRERVACAAVKRAMAGPLADEGLTGISATTETAGPFSQQVTYATPQGDLYLTKAERRSLGGGHTGAFEANLLANRGGTP